MRRSKAAALLVVVWWCGAALVACTSTSAGGPPASSPSSTAVASTTTNRSTSGSDTTAVEPPLTVEQLAAELSAVEAGIRADGVGAAELDSLGRRQQLAYREVNRRPEWHAQLVALVDPVAQVPLQFHLAARTPPVANSTGGQPPEPPATLPPWTIVDPLPVDELLGYYREAEAATGVPWEYLAAIHFQETRMGRIDGVSSAGAVGPMQFLPTTWAECCTGDPTATRDAILGAAQYLVDRGAPGDMLRALHGYNPSDNYVRAVNAYAQNIMADERAYLGYHGWQVFYGTTEGTVRLPVGYRATQPIDVVTYLADHPDDRVQPLGGISR